MANLLYSARFVTIWIAAGLLLIICQIVAPQTLSSDSLSTLLPLATVVAVAALGQMLVVNTGGIDLSVAGTISLLANVVVGASGGLDDRLLSTVLIVVAVAALIGLFNGIFVGILEFNPLIVTLATGIVLGGITQSYRLGTAAESQVPPALSQWALEGPLGISWIFWAGFVIMGAVALFLRSTPAGRRFQAVGANRRAAWIIGIRVRRYIVSAYVGCSVAAGLAAILLAAIISSPGSDPGAPYLFAPIAAVVLGGASLSGGLSSATSTWVAAFALGVLNQMLRVLGLSTAMQFVVFGAAIILGLMISGDRIARVVAPLVRGGSSADDPRSERAAAESPT